MAASKDQSQREAWWAPFVSRAAMLVLGLALLYGGWRCIGWQQQLDADPTTQQIRDAGDRHRSLSGRGVGARAAADGITHLPMIVAIVLLPLGGIACIAAVTPMWILERFVPPA